MKRFLSAGLLCLSLILIFAAVHLTADRYRYAGLCTDDPSFAAIKEGRTESGKELIRELKFGGYPLFHDETAGRWFYSVSGEDPETDPPLKYSAEDRSVRIAFSGSIRAGNTVPMIAYSTAEYKEYELVITTLPLLSIECADPAWFPESTVRETVPMKLTLFDNRPETLRPWTVSEGTVHIRGWSSKQYPKKGLRLTLTAPGTGRESHENQTALLGLRPDGDWLLYAAYNDQERVRNVFSSNLWMASCGTDNSFGLQNGMEYHFVELFWNGRYWGLYALGYPVDTLRMRISPDSQGHYDEFIFKQKEWGPDTASDDPEESGIYPEFEADPSDLNNGYGLLGNFFRLAEAKDPAALWHTDEANAIDIWLFMKLIQPADSLNKAGQMKNMIFTVKKSDEGRKILFTPWDMDITWGNMLNNRYPNFTRPYALKASNNNYEMTYDPVSWLVTRDKAILEQVKQRWTELRQTFWSEEQTGRMLDRLEAEIFGSGAYARDIERWPDSSAEAPGDGLGTFRTYVFDRLRAMDDYITGLGTDNSNTLQ